MHLPYFSDTAFGSHSFTCRSFQHFRMFECLVSVFINLRCLERYPHGLRTIFNFFKECFLVFWGLAKHCGTQCLKYSQSIQTSEYVIVFVHTYICIYIYIYIHLSLYIYIYISLNNCVCVCVYIYIYIYVCMYVCMYVYVYIYLYVYIYM